MNNLLEELKKIKTIADVGLLYCNNAYDKERYTDLQDICLTMLHLISDNSLDSLKLSFPVASDYPTVKVDIRALVLSNENKILMVKESADGAWSLPGGWADVGFSPKEVVIKEVKEETGLHVVPARLLAVFDKKMHPHPPQPFSVYKMVFYCEAITTEITKGFDVMDVQFFSIDNLPSLSEDRILKSQVELIFRQATAPGADPYFD